MGDDWQSAHNALAPRETGRRAHPRACAQAVIVLPTRQKFAPGCSSHTPGGKRYSVFLSGESLVQLVEGVCPRRMDGVRVGNHGLETVFGDLHNLVQGHADLSKVRTLNTTPAISKKLIG